MGKWSSSTPAKLGCCAAGYALLLPPDKQTYTWPPMWVGDAEGGYPKTIGLPHVLEGTPCGDCRDELVLSHIEVLGQWTDLAGDLLAQTYLQPDPRREDVGRVLVFLAGELSQALSWEGIDLDADVAAMAMEAISEAVKTASLCLGQSLFRQMAATL